MKNILLIGFVLIVLVLSVEPALAWYRGGYGRGYGHGYYPRGYSNFGVFIGPPAIFVPPPPVGFYYYRSYPPDYGYYEQGDRVWVPGYWEYRETPYGWKKVWIPGHWEWR